MNSNYDDKKYDDYLVPDWIRELDLFFGKPVQPAHIGRPFKKINESLLIQLHNEGYSNRRIARELGFSRRTIDYRMISLRERGLID